MIYATPEELAAYLDPDADPVPAAPPLATVLLRSASALVLDATAGAVYTTNTEGLPTDPLKLAALKEATLEQAGTWSLHGIDPRKGASQIQRRVASKSVTGVQVSFVKDDLADLAQTKLAEAVALIPSALAILDRAGLISNRVSNPARVERFNVTQRYYDPLTGQLDA